MRHMVIAATIAAAIASSAAAQEPNAEDRQHVLGANATTLRDVPYAPAPHAEQHLDLHWPGGSPQATVLFLHGGGLTENGQRRGSEMYADVCGAFVAAGIACATADYRLAPSFTWPAMPLDVAAAVERVRELVAERGGEPGRLFLFGHSSGCALAASLGTNPEYLSTVGLAPSDLAGVVAMGCVLDNYDAALRGLTVDAMRERFARSRSDVERFGTPEEWIAANPSYHVGPHAPPFLVVVARQERFFPAILEQGARFVRRLLEEDVPGDVVVVPGTHRSSIEGLDEPGDPTFHAILAFIRDPRAAR